MSTAAACPVHGTDHLPWQAGDLCWPGRFVMTSTGVRDTATAAALEAFATQEVDQ